MKQLAYLAVLRVCEFDSGLTTKRHSIEADFTKAKVKNDLGHRIAKK